MSDRLKAYARAGVDVDLGNKVKAGLPALVKSANRPEVLGKVGGFGGLFSARFPEMRDPVLVASIDGVGTKIKVAVLMNRHDTIGEDLVNHCVNDIAVLGAEPLFFLDYMASERLDPHRFRQLITGMIRGCKKAGCALIGGETAQMPGIYHGADYDLVGTIVGVVDRARIIDGKSIRPGDAVIGLPSSGLHTNGYSLAREILFNQLGCRLEARTDGLRGTLGDELLRTHTLYLPQIRKVRAQLKIKGIAHITGGGLMDNIPRVLPEGRRRRNPARHLDGLAPLPAARLRGPDQERGTPSGLQHGHRHGVHRRGERCGENRPAHPRQNHRKDRQRQPPRRFEGTG